MSLLDIDTTQSRGRDTGRALAAAQQMLENAQRVNQAVRNYHEAADRIDAAQLELSQATTDRLAAIGAMRSCGLTMNEIGQLTGLSTSRVQTLAKETESPQREDDSAAA